MSPSINNFILLVIMRQMWVICITPKTWTKKIESMTKMLHFVDCKANFLKTNYLKEQKYIYFQKLNYYQTGGQPFQVLWCISWAELHPRWLHPAIWQYKEEVRHRFFIKLVITYYCEYLTKQSDTPPRGQLYFPSINDKIMNAKLNLKRAW